MGTPFFRTSDLAKELGVHVNTIRLYEASRFLAPIPRGMNGYRQYSALLLQMASVVIPQMGDLYNSSVCPAR